jgi:hypothetical protein
MRLALKAQSQCRTTVEALGGLKNLQPVASVKQAYIGKAVHVHLNNGTVCDQISATRGGKSKNEQNELLTAKHGETLDTCGTSTASAIDPAMETVRTINRP